MGWRLGSHPSIAPSAAGTAGCATGETALSPPSSIAALRGRVWHNQSKPTELKRIQERKGWLGFFLLFFRFLSAGAQVSLFCLMP